MQSLEVISVNLWHILISLCNLLVLFLILKRFLYRPVKRVLAERKAALDGQYAAAAEARGAAEDSRRAWEERLGGAQAEAARLLEKAGETANIRGEKILSDAREKADGIVRRAEAQAALERRKAEADIRREIVDVSAVLAEKMLGREIHAEDHRAMIDSFIEEMEEANDADR